MAGQKTHQSIRYVAKNWRPLSSCGFLIAAIVLNFLGEPAALAAIAAATMSLVLMVWHLGEASVIPLVVEGGMQEAKPVILDQIDKFARRRRASRPLLVRVIGCRLRDIRSVLDSLNDRRCKNVSMEIFHIDPDFLRTQPWPGASRDTEDVNLSVARIKELGKTLESRNVRFSFYSYQHRPIIWCYDVGERFLAWGYFMWEDVEGTYKGPRNPGFVLKAGDPGFDETLEWIDSLSEEWRGRDRAKTGASS